MRSPSSSPARHENPVEALIPTGWYPSAVATSAGGGRVFVVNRKSPPGPNPQGCAPELAIYRGQPNACGAANQYIYQLEKAGLLEFPLPDERALATATMQVAANIGLPGAAERAAADARMAEIRARVKHVVFIIKENRTYDQVLGDLDIGNGDPHLAILGEALVAQSSSPRPPVRDPRQFLRFRRGVGDRLVMVYGGPRDGPAREDRPGELRGPRACL